MYDGPEVDAHFEKPLVIHPRDRSTDFLKPIYAKLDCNVVTESTGDEALDFLLEHAERVIMLGHGCPSGIFSCGVSKRLCAVSDQQVNLIHGKDNVYIWCYASAFVEKHNLKGFSTGMFISEDSEADYIGVKHDAFDVEDNNEEFARLVGEYIHLPGDQILDNVSREFNADMIPYNDVVEYNSNLLRYFP